MQCTENFFFDWPLLFVDEGMKYSCNTCFFNSKLFEYMNFIYKLDIIWEVVKGVDGD